MNRKTVTLLGVGVGLAVANVAIAYYTSASRTGRLPGQNALLDFNDSIAKINPLKFLFPTTAASSNSGPTVVGATTFAPLPAPVVTDTAGGTTTYWGG